MSRQRRWKLFEIKVIESCPVTKANVGRMRIQTQLLGEIAGTLKKQIGLEWGAILTGTRSKDGLQVDVTGMLVPKNQIRSAGNVEFPKMVLREDVVGVIHSHHSMGAFFSGTDYASFNNKFPSSIVVSSKVDENNPQEVWLGFSYLAVGQVILPCGNLGSIPFHLEPLEKVPGWVVMDEPKIKIDVKVTDMGDCDKSESQPVNTPLWASHTALCGVKHLGRVRNAFGLGKGAINEALPAPEYAKHHKKHHNKGFKVVDKRTPGFTRGVIATSQPVDDEYKGDINPKDFNSIIHDPREWSSMSETDQDKWLDSVDLLKERITKAGLLLRSFRNLTVEQGHEKMDTYESMWKRHFKDEEDHGTSTINH
jgi:proteasome lid subunit RPN8/RPN11